MTNRKLLLITALLVFILTAILFLVSYFVQPLLPAGWNNALILAGIALAAVLAALSGANDALQLLDRLFGRSGSEDGKPELGDGRPNGRCERVSHYFGAFPLSDSPYGALEMAGNV